MSDDINFYSNEVHHGDVKVYGDQIRLGCGSNVTTNGPCIWICGNEVCLHGNYTYIYGQYIRIGSSSSSSYQEVKLNASSFTYNCKEVATKCYVDDCVAANMGGSGNVDACCFLQLNCSSLNNSSQILNYGSFVVKDYMGVCGSMVVCGIMEVGEKANVCGDIKVCGEAFIDGDMNVCGDLKVSSSNENDYSCIRGNCLYLQSVNSSGNCFNTSVTSYGIELSQSANAGGVCLYIGNRRSICLSDSIAACFYDETDQSYHTGYPTWSEIDHRISTSTYEAKRVHNIVALCANGYSCLISSGGIDARTLYFVYPD